MDKLQPSGQSWRGRFGLIALSVACLAALDGATFFTYTANLKRGVYPVDADSIGIPIGLAWMSSIVALIWVIVAVCLPRRSKIWRGVSVLMLALLTAAFVNDALASADGDHWPIALVNLLAAACHAYIAKACWCGTQQPMKIEH